MFLHARRSQETIQHILDLSFIGGFPKDERKFRILIKPVREPIPTVTINPFVVNIKIPVSLVVIPGVNRIVGASLQENGGFRNTATILVALRRSLPETNAIVFQDKTITPRANKQIVLVIFEQLGDVQQELLCEIVVEGKLVLEINSKEDSSA